MHLLVFMYIMCIKLSQNHQITKDFKNDSYFRLPIDKVNANTQLSILNNAMVMQSKSRLSVLCKDRFFTMS